MTTNKSFDPRMEFDVVTLTYSGDVVWIDYGNPRHVVVCGRWENPRDVVRRQREQQRQMKFRFHVEDN